MKKLLLVFIVITGLFFSFYRLAELSNFDYDQERDYYQIKSIAIDHKFTLVGPRVVSSAGFFLGPWYYYLQVPFFIIFRGDPLYGAYFTATINFTIFLLIYFVLKSLTSSRLLALCAAIFWLSGANRSSWNVSFVPLFFLVFIYIYEKLRRKKTLLLLFLLTLAWSFSLNFHPQMVFLLPVWICALDRRLKSAVLVLIALLIPFSPLIVFDLRHDFLDTRAVINFLTASSANNAAISPFRLGYSLAQFSPPVFLPLPALGHYVPFSLLLLVIGCLFVARNRRYLYFFLVPLISILLLSFYRQKTWPEYYHFLGGFSLMLLIFITASRNRYLKVVILLLSLVVIWENYRSLVSYTNPVSYHYKRAAILYMLEQNQPYERLNIVNDFRLGEGLGFSPIREYYEKPTGLYHPQLKFYISTSDGVGHNQTRNDFGYYSVSKVY